MNAFRYWIWAAAGFSMGIWYVHMSAGSGGLWAAAAAAAAAAFSFCLMSRCPMMLPLSCVLILAASGMMRMYAESSIWQAQSHYLTGHTGQYEMTVKEEGKIMPDEGVRYKASLDSVAFQGGEIRNIQGTVFLYLPAGLPEFLPGSRLSVYGEIETVRIYKNPGKIDLASRYEGERLIGKIFSADEENVVYQGISDQYRTERWALQCRKKIGHIFAPYMDPVRLPIFMTLLFGGSYSDIPPSVLSDFSVTGLIHILSVSGSHIALLFGFMFFIGRAAGMPQKLSVLLASVLIVMYGILAGMVPPVFRAVVMGLLTAGGLLCSREGRALDFLGLAVLVMLSWNPLYLFDISFQLSVGASAGILLWGKPWALWLKKHTPVPFGMAEGTAVTASSQILTVPFVLWNFHGIPLYAAVSNMAAGPFLEASIIAGLTASAVCPVSEALAGGLVQCADYFIGISLWIVHAVGQWPYARLHTGGISSGGIIFYYAAAGILLVILRCHRPFRAAAFFIWGAVLVRALFSFFSQNALTVLVPDLGQARAVVMITDKACAVYYKNGRAGTDMGQRELQSFLEYYGIFSIDFLFMDLHQERDPMPFSLSMPISYAGFSSGRYPFLCATLLKSMPDRAEMIPPGESVRLGELKGYYAGGNWYFSMQGAGILIDGGQEASRPYLSCGDSFLWVGGAPEAGALLNEKKIRRIDPASAVYTGRAGSASEENKELFRLLGKTVYDPAENGAVSALWDGQSWRMSGADILGE